MEAHSKTQTNNIIAYVGIHQQRFDELVHLFLHGDYRITQRAGWPMSYIAAEHPELVQKHLANIIGNLGQPNLHNAVKRNTVRFLQHIDIPENLQGIVMDCCFRFIDDPKEAVAVKAFSLTILHNLSKKYPEIVPEIKMIVAARLPHETAAFKSRAKKFL